MLNIFEPKKNKATEKMTKAEAVVNEQTKEEPETQTKTKKHGEDGVCCGGCGGQK